MFRGIAELVALFCLVVPVNQVSAQSWKKLTVDVDSNLRGISAARIPATNHIAIWASGSHGVILRSLDEGSSWTRLAVSGHPELDFRGIVAISDTTAYLMSSGEGVKSRIYKTTTGGANWELQYTDTNKSFFLDSIACLSEKSCFALGDPIDGKFLILQTADGLHWKPWIAHVAVGAARAALGPEAALEAVVFDALRRCNSIRAAG